jgi:predicted RNase H-like HicB family nuclease
MYLCYNQIAPWNREVIEMTTKIKKITALKFWVRIVVEKDSNGFYSYTPSLKGIHMGGDNPEEALEMAKQAASLMLKTMIEDGDPIPIDVLEKREQEKTPVSTDVVISTLEEIQINLK